MKIHIWPGLWLLATGCALQSVLVPPPELEYYLEAKAVLPEGEVYYTDPIDSSVVWSQEGVQVKVKFFTDKMLDAQYNPKFSPYTLTPWKDPRLGYTPPLWTVFEVTVINRTRERVELDPTQAVLQLEDGNFYYCRQGAGLWWDPAHYFDYSYVKWTSRDGDVQYYANFDRNDIWNKSEYKREKPVAKGNKYSGKLTFPRLPPQVESVDLEIRNFILAFDKFAVGYGNPAQFTDLKFHFEIKQGTREVARKK
ncbi:MAG: hypothetical protein HYW07_01835 [Candidatus Latescibacteria bacterium]|nr:hypothetical protein [Candidatus Latescibacterota bacterium]